MSLLGDWYMGSEVILMLVMTRILTNIGGAEEICSKQKEIEHNSDE